MSEIGRPDRTSPGKVDRRREKWETRGKEEGQKKQVESQKKSKFHQESFFKEEKRGGVKKQGRLCWKARNCWTLGGGDRGGTVDKRRWEGSGVWERLKRTEAFSFPVSPREGWVIVRPSPSFVLLLALKVGGRGGLKKTSIVSRRTEVFAFAGKFSS